jgi:hypothetical protein
MKLSQNEMTPNTSQRFRPAIHSCTAWSKATNAEIKTLPRMYAYTLSAALACISTADPGDAGLRSWHIREEAERRWRAGGDQATIHHPRHLHSMAGDLEHTSKAQAMITPRFFGSPTSP